MKKEVDEIIGDEHFCTSADTPLRPDAFEKTDREKIEIIEYHFRQIMLALGLNLNDDSLKGTPYRVAKMYVKEIFSGLHPNNKPKLSVFENKYGYNHMLVEKNITLHSNCEHHFVPILGKVHIAYIPSDKVIGLSKLNRLVQYYAKRPQVQERLGLQVAAALKQALDTDDVAVYIDAKHLCVSTRGVKDEASSTVTTVYSGLFEEANTRNEFLRYINTER
jgi:GTP cyclohydrolase IA